MSTEQLFWEMVRGGKKPLKKLPSQFEGQGVKEGYWYYQLQRNAILFLYEVTEINTREKHYEVFYSWRDEDANEELFPYEEQVLEELELFSDNAAAMQRWIQLTREAGERKQCPKEPCL